jgi:hypothetical protein
VAFEEWLAPGDMKELTTALLVPEGNSSSSSSGTGSKARSRSHSPTKGSSETSIRFDSFLGYGVDSIEEPAEADLHRTLQAAAFKKAKYSPQNLLSLFEKIDTKKKGFIRFGEFVRIVRKFYSALSGREEKLLKARLDASVEGIVDYYGFVWWLSIGRPDYAEEVSVVWCSVVWCLLGGGVLCVTMSSRCICLLYTCD